MQVIGKNLFGVPQGSIFRALLSNIFSCDLLFIMNDIDFSGYLDDILPHVIVNDIEDVIFDGSFSMVYK